MKKSSLQNINRDRGRCNDYGPQHNPAVEFDDENCIAFTSVCLYKFGQSRCHLTSPHLHNWLNEQGKFEFNWILPMREEYPVKAKIRPFISGQTLIQFQKVKMPTSQNCQTFNSYVEFDETHCVPQPAVQDYVLGVKSWEDLMETRWHKYRFGTAATTTTTSRPVPPRKEIGKLSKSLIL